MLNILKLPLETKIGGILAMLIFISCTLYSTNESTPPPKISYASPLLDTIGKAVSDTPSLVGGTITHFAVSPNLPAGLSLDTLTGIISGIPTGASVATNYTITATGPGGSTSVILSISVFNNRIGDFAPTAVGNYWLYQATDTTVASGPVYITTDTVSFLVVGKSNDSVFLRIHKHEISSATGHPNDTTNSDLTTFVLDDGISIHNNVQFGIGPGSPFYQTHELPSDTSGIEEQGDGTYSFTQQISALETKSKTVYSTGIGFISYSYSNRTSLCCYSGSSMTLLQFQENIPNSP